MAIYKDFAGLNYCIYDPTESDYGSYGDGTNTLGYNPSNTGSGGGNPLYWYTSSVGYGNISKMTQAPTARVLVLLNLHRNGPYGYGSWKQIRTSNNHLSRYQRAKNIFTYVREPGDKYQITINGKQYDHLDRFGGINKFKEPAVVDSYKPLDLIGGITVYNPNTNKNELRSVSLKTSFSNETVFFANDEINQYYETIVESDESYEDLKELYLNGALDEAKSPIERFNMLIYKQTVFPKMKYSYLNKTRSRLFFVNKFWRDSRADRTQLQVDSDFGTILPKQSMWNLDTRDDFTSRATPTRKTQDFYTGPTLIATWWTFDYPIGGVMSASAGTTATQYNTTGASGILQNTYAHLYSGQFLSGATNTLPWSLNDSQFGQTYDEGDINLLLSSSCYYARKHTLTNIDSLVAQTGMFIQERYGTTLLPNNYVIPTASLFLGEATWDAGKQAGKNPFYDSYEEFAVNTKLKGQGYSKIPEFKISSHVATYEKLGVTEELKAIFELSGAQSENTTTANSTNFYKELSNSDFLKHFDLIKKDHQDFVDPSVLTLKCKAIKKFLPYEGFYPADRCVQLSKQLYSSFSSFIKYQMTGAQVQESAFSFQSFLEPLFAPGILFNTIKSGVAVDYPIIANGASPGGIFTSPNGQNYGINVMLTGSDRSGANWGNLESVFSKRIPFEALISPEDYLANELLSTQEPHPFGLGGLDLLSSWNGQGNKTYSKMMSNFLAEVPEFFIKNQNFSTITSLETQDVNFGNAESGSFYAMRIKMYRSKNGPNDTFAGFGTTYVTPPQNLYGSSHKSGQEKYKLRETFTMYSRPSGFGPPMFGGGFPSASYANFSNTPSGRWNISGSDSLWGYNWAYTPPYYHGDAWCDLLFECTASKKYTANEILEKVKEHPYYTRFWWNGTNDALRDLTGYRNNWDHGNTTTSYFSSAKAVVETETGITIPAGKVPFEGRYKNYDSSAWATLISSGKIGRGTIGMYLPALGKYQNFSMAALITPPSTFPDLAKIDIGNVNIRPRWGTRYNFDGYGLSDPTGAWAGPPVNYALESLNRTGSFPYHPYYLNSNALQLESSMNLFGLGSVKKVNLDGDGTEERAEVATAETTQAKSRWIIQTKFETPMLNFNKYKESGCTSPSYASESVPRGMWLQYGEIPEEQTTGVFVQVEDIPSTWWKGALGINTAAQVKIKSLADLVGMPKTPVKLGQVAEIKEISECVVAVPFVENNGERKFFSIPRGDINDVISALRREVEPGVFVAGGPPKVGNTIIDMVKKMKKYSFPPSMDFVKYEEIDPFAMYIFEFKHSLTKKDLSDIWQNLPPEIGVSFAEQEVSISHELLAHELLGGGSKIVNDKLNENARGNEIESDIRWMVFKVKKRAKTNYFDKVVAKKGTSADTSKEVLENIDNAQLGENPDITFNWPYDYFSLVELIKLDAEITFAEVENDDKGNKTFKPKAMDPALAGIAERMARGISVATGNKKDNK